MPATRRLLILLALALPARLSAGTPNACTAASDRGATTSAEPLLWSSMHDCGNKPLSIEPKVFGKCFNATVPAPGFSGKCSECYWAATMCLSTTCYKSCGMDWAKNRTQDCVTCAAEKLGADSCIPTLKFCAGVPLPAFNATTIAR